MTKLPDVALLRATPVQGPASYFEVLNYVSTWQLCTSLAFTNRQDMNLHRELGVFSNKPPCSKVLRYLSGLQLMMWCTGAPGDHVHFISPSRSAFR